MKKLYIQDYICTNIIVVKEQYGFKIHGSTEAASYQVLLRLHLIK